jgi:hypothetical protein
MKLKKLKKPEKPEKLFKRLYLYRLEYQYDSDDNKDPRFCSRSPEPFARGS